MTGVLIALQMHAGDSQSRSLRLREPIDSSSQTNTKLESSSVSSANEPVAGLLAVNEEVRVLAPVRREERVRVAKEEREKPKAKEHPSASALAPPDVSPLRINTTNTVVVLPATQQRHLDSELSEQLTRSQRLLLNGAYMTARQNGFSVIRRIAERRCDVLGGNGPLVALATAETAIRESSDFLREGIDPSAMTRYIEAHATTLLQGLDVTRLSPHQAADIYLNFAIRQFAESLGPSAIGGQALGLVAESYLRDSDSEISQRPHGLTCLRAAVACCPTDFRLANQLGYELLAEGRLEEAEVVLKVATSLARHGAPWQNLAEIHRRRGDLDLARQCAALAVAYAQPAEFPFEVVELTAQQFAMVSPQMVPLSGNQPGVRTATSQQANPKSSATPPQPPRSGNGLSLWR